MCKLIKLYEMSHELFFLILIKEFKNIIRILSLVIVLKSKDICEYLKIFNVFKLGKNIFDFLRFHFILKKSYLNRIHVTKKLN